ncbi:cytochrome P450 [Fusarium solani]|uniref:Cytochrome P450 n=1 Tax=Fusarium solani TaxID=169388 RepID=A0A9P9R6Y8_FUSSL|nr:cytochrome P450 [Fusarium solani]KAH7268656.1 cytochrome P450 [Fusarium solani]
MGSFIILSTVLVLLFIVQPLARYLWDPQNLRRFPSHNALSGITNLGYIIERCRGFRSRYIHEAHKKHNIVRIGPNSLSFSSPEAIRSIYGHSTNCIKGDMYAAPAGPHASLLDVINKEAHARKRRYMSHALATRNLETWEHKVVDKVRRLIRQFDRICDEAASATNTKTGTLDFRKWANLFTVEAIADIALSHKLGCLDRGDDQVTITTADGNEKRIKYIECLHASKRATSTLVWATSWFRFLRTVLTLLPGWFRSQWLKGSQFDDMVHHLTRVRVERHRTGETLDDIVHCLIADKNGELRGLDIGEIEAEVGVLLDAGSDTTAIALTHVMYNLLRHPKALQRLRDELKETLDVDSPVASYGQVKNLPYLRACLDESLRLLPPVSFGLNRKTSLGGLTIDGQWIDEGTTVGVPAYTAHRNPELFPDPERYYPERWLEEMNKDAMTSFIPFSAGARGCIGRNITYMEQMILIASLVRRYDFALLHDDWELDHEEAFNLWPGPMPLSISKRQDLDD